MKKKDEEDVRLLVKVIRRHIADYMRSEGCNCCCDTTEHNRVKAKLAKLLRVPMYKDKSGYDFGRFSTKPTKSL